MKTFTIVIQLLVVLTLNGYTQTTPEPHNDSAASQFQDAFNLLIEADKARDNGAYINAVEVYSKALKAYSEFSDKYPGWKPALTEFRRRYCSDQIDFLRKEIDSGKALPRPTDKMTQPKREGQSPDARIYNLLNSGQFKEAYELLFENMRANPDNIQTRFLLGVIHCRMKKYENAVHLLEPLTEEAPEMAQVHVALATAYAGQHRMAEAEDALATAIKKDPSLAEAHYNMAHIQMQKENSDTRAAKKYYTRSVELGGKRDRKLETTLGPGQNSKQ